MFKSLLAWLTGTEPISRWLLIVILLGMLAAIVTSLKMIKKGSENNGL